MTPVPVGPSGDRLRHPDADGDTFTQREQGSLELWVLAYRFQIVGDTAAGVAGLDGLAGEQRPDVGKVKRAGFDSVVGGDDAADGHRLANRLEGRCVALFLVVDEHHVEGTVVALDDVDGVAVLEVGAVGVAATPEVLTRRLEFVGIDFGENDFFTHGRCHPVRRVAKARAELEDAPGVGQSGEQPEPPTDGGTDGREPLAVGPLVHLPEYLVAFRRDAASELLGHPGKRCLVHTGRVSCRGVNAVTEAGRAWNVTTPESPSHVRHIGGGSPNSNDGPPSPFGMERTVEIVPEAGLHARPASKFVQTANEYDSTVEVGLSDGDLVPANSMLSVTGLGAKHGDTVRLVADGDDAEAALDALEALLSTPEGDE